MLLPEKWRKKFAFLSPHVGRAGKAFLNHFTISKLYPWAKNNIKWPNGKNWHLRGHPLCHTAASNITYSAIADQESSLSPTCTVAHSTAVLYTVVPSCAVALACTVHDLHTPQWALPERVRFCATPTWPSACTWTACMQWCTVHMHSALAVVCRWNVIALCLRMSGSTRTARDCTCMW